MDCNGCCAVVLEDLGQFHHIDAAPVPAQSGFHRHRHIHGVSHRPDNAPSQSRVLHQGAAVAVVDDFGHGAAHIEIEKITAGVGQGQFGSLGHDLRIVAENLCATQACRRFFQKADAFFILIDQGTGGHHLRHRHRRPHPGADGPEGQIRDAGHGRQHRQTAGL